MNDGAPNPWREHESLVDDQLSLQVEMQWDQHRAFLDRHGLPSCRRVVDMGTGNGVFLDRLAQAYPALSFIGVDNRENMLSLAQRRSRANITWARNDVLTCERIAPLRHADGVLLRYLLLHLQSVPAFLARLARTLREGTRLWIIDLDLEQFLADPPHRAFEMIHALVRTYCDRHGGKGNTGSGLEALLTEAGFRHIERETEALDTDHVSLPLLQKFLLQEVVAYRDFLPDSLPPGQFDVIRAFIEDLPRGGTFVRYGVGLTAAIR